MDRDIDTLKAVLADAAKKREALQDEKLAKIQWLAGRYDAKIKKYDIYIEMLKGEIGEETTKKQGIPQTEEPIQPKLLKRIRPITEPEQAPVLFPGTTEKGDKEDNKPYSEVMEEVLREHRKPMKVRQIIDAMEKKGQEIRAKQKFSAAMRILKRNNTVFYRRGRTWGLVEWRQKRQENAQKEEGSASG